MTMQAAVDELRDVAQAVTGIEYKPDDPPESVSHGPMIAAWSEGGESKHSPNGVMTMLDSVVIALVKPITELPDDIDQLMPFRDSVPRAIIEHQIGSLFDELETFTDITHDLRSEQWGGTLVRGLFFTVRQVKVQVILT